MELWLGRIQIDVLVSFLHFYENNTSKYIESNHNV